MCKCDGLQTVVFFPSCFFFFKKSGLCLGCQILSLFVFPSSSFFFLPLLHFCADEKHITYGEREREMGGAFILPSGVGKTTTSTFTTTRRSRRSSHVVSAAQRKKSNQKKVDKTKTEFIEQEDAKLAMFERAQAATRRNSNSNSSSSSSSMDNDALDSFEAKLKRVQEEGKTKAKMVTTTTNASSSSPFGGGGITPISPLAPTFGGEPVVPRKSGDDDDEDVFKSPIVRIGSLLAAIALAIVFIPTDLTFNAIGSKQVQEKYRKEALEDIEKQKDELTKVLESTPNDPELLKQQAKNFLALDDYPSALPLMEKLVSLEDTEANSMAIAEVWNLDGQPERALSVLKDYADKHLSDSSGPPSASFLKALTDSLSKNNRQGVALAYVDAFVKKNPGDIDDVDAELLKARVYSGWKGKGKEAEKAFSDVVEKHPEDFRGYLARGVFMREIGRPDEASSMFKQAEALAPAGDTKAVVKDVISRANKEKSGSVQL